MKRMVYITLLCFLSALSCAGSDKDSVQTTNDVSIICAEIDSLSKKASDIESMVQDIKADLEDNESSNTLPSLYIVIVVVLLAIICWMWHKTSRTKAEKNGQEAEPALHQVQKLMQMAAEMKEISIRIEKEIREIREIRELHSDNFRQPQPARPIFEPVARKERQPVSQEERQPVSQNGKKYASFSQDINGQMSINEWDLADDPDGQLFEICFNGDGANASFKINRNNVGNMLHDLPNLRNYANDFKVPPMPQDIRVIEPGTLKRSGDSWIMDRKMTIKIV